VGGVAAVRRPTAGGAAATASAYTAAGGGCHGPAGFAHGGQGPALLEHLPPSQVVVVVVVVLVVVMGVLVVLLVVLLVAGPLALLPILGLSLHMGPERGAATSASTFRERRERWSFFLLLYC